MRQHLNPTTRAWLGVFALLAFLLMSTPFEVAAQGKVVFEGPITSAVLGTNRTIRIYLPPSYEREPRRRYPVLYLHDGQNAFTTAGPHVAFGWGNWGLDQTVNELVAAGRMREIIMVAIDNTQARYREYRGLVAGGSAPDSKSPRRPASDDAAHTAYTRFLIEELKPKIDRDYRTLPGVANTGVMGSSMGGICSLALAWEHPKVFGNAACLASSFQIEKRYFLEQVLRPYQGKRKPFAVYLDSGAVDYSGGDDGRKHTEAVVAELRRIGWKDGKTLQHYLDVESLTEAQYEQAGLPRSKWAEANTSRHNEFYWRWRAWRPLTFMFPPK